MQHERLAVYYMHELPLPIDIYDIQVAEVCFSGFRRLKAATTSYGWVGPSYFTIKKDPKSLVLRSVWTKKYQ